MSGGPFDIFGLGADPDKPEDSPARKAQILSARPLPKRFYETVDIVEADGFELRLDGRPVRTPARKVINLADRDVADAVAEEWRMQDAVIDPKRMPLTRLINSALDGVSTQMEEVADEVARFAGNDLLCYRADDPERLVQRQCAAWDPVLTWAEKTYDCRFELAGGLMPISQPEETVRRMREAVHAYTDPLALAALHSMTTLMGSCLLSLAVAEKFLSRDEAWQAAHIDEDWNIEQWGDDEEASSRRAYRFEEMKGAVLLIHAGRHGGEGMISSSAD